MGSRLDHYGAAFFRYTRFKLQKAKRKMGSYALHLGNGRLGKEGYLLAKISVVSTPLFVRQLCFSPAARARAKSNQQSDGAIRRANVPEL